MRNSESKYYRRLHKIIKVIEYAFINGVIFAFLISLYFVIIKRSHTFDYIKVYFAVYFILTGITNWIQYSNIDASSIDTIEIDKLIRYKK